MEKIQNEITIDNYQHKYKDELSNEYYSYRCKYRKVCKILIKINKENLVKLKNNSSDNFDYTITSRDKIHKCNKKIDIDEEKNESEDDYINIILTKYQIKNISQNIREESYPSNDKFLKDIS